MQRSASLPVPPRVRRIALSLLLLIPLLALAGVSGSAVAAQDDITVTMVTDTAGLGDQNFNDAVREGLARAEEDFGITVNVAESRSAPDFIPNLTAGAEQSDLTIGVGFLLTEAMTEVSGQYPDSRFVLIDSAPLEERDNVISALFREQEGGFLAGVVAGLTTRTGRVGVLGGQFIPPVERYEVGFRAGVEAVAPEVEVNVVYADTFGDPALGREQSLAQYNNGADIVFAIAGDTGTGVFEAAAEAGEGNWVIAADKDQEQVLPGYQLAVATKSLAAAAYEAVRSVVEGTFEAGVQDVGVAEGGTGLEDPYGRVAPEVMAVVEQYRQAIIDGTLTVPATREELETFEAPALGSPVAGSPVASPAPGSPVASPAA
jgi:basic membrane protein A